MTIFISGEPIEVESVKIAAVILDAADFSEYAHASGCRVDLQFDLDDLRKLRQRLIERN